MMEWIVSSSVLIAVVIALRHVLKGRISLRMQYALWLLVALRLLLPVSIGESRLSVGSAADAVRTEIVIVREERAAETVLPDDGGEVTQPAAPVVPVAPAGDTVIDTAPAEPTLSIDWAAVLKALWLFGAAAVGLTFAAVNLRFGRQLRRSRQRVEAESALPVYVSAAAETPCLFGLLRPTIYLTPETWADAQARRCAIAHEETHRRHGDHVWSALRGAALALHWYNPLVWWAANLSRRDAELACDEATVRRLGEGERAAYGRTLIRMTCEKRPTLLVTATTMADDGKNLRERITLLVKRPKTAATAAVVLAAVLAVAAIATFTDGKAEPEEPFGGQLYQAKETVFSAAELEGDFTEETLPALRAADGGLTLIDAWDGEYAYTAPETQTLTEESFDVLFTSDFGWAGGQSAGKLRRGNAAAWRATAIDPTDGMPNLLYFLQQRDGTCYLVLGYEMEEQNFFRWVLRLERVESVLWESEEAYIASRVEELKQPGGYRYAILPDGASDGGDSITVEEAAADVRVQRGETVRCAGVASEGDLELWTLRFEVKPVDEAGALPEHFLWVGGNAISDDGYISTGFREYIVALHTDRGYRILDTSASNDGLGWYNDHEQAYLHDFYVDYAGLSLPKYYITDFLPEGALLTGDVPQTSEDRCGIRVDGTGYYLYTQRLFEQADDASWQSRYGTGSTLRIDPVEATAARQGERYRSLGFAVQDGTDNAAVWGLRGEDGTWTEHHLVEASDGGCYDLTLSWTPTEDATLRLHGHSRKDMVENESRILRAMAASFTPTQLHTEVKINDNGETLSKLRTDAERYTVPEGVTNIVTFSCYDLPTLREITLPEGLKEIGNCAFQNCTALESITLPTTVAKLGVGAFGRCTALQTAELGDCAVWQLRDTVFARCTALTDVTLPPKIQSIGQRTFYQCRSLRSVTVPDGVKSIGEEAFAECASLETITLSAALESIGAQAFAGCTSLREIVIPGGVTELPRWAFADCENLERVTIPSSVTKIRSLAFQHCDKLTIVCEAGSAAEAYAKKNGIPTRSIAEEQAEYQRFHAALTLAADGGAESLRFAGRSGTTYPAQASLNTVDLNRYSYVKATAREQDGDTLLLDLADGAGSCLAFYRGTNVVGYYTTGCDPVFYEAQGSFSIVDNDGRTLYDRMCSWYDEAQCATLQAAVTATAIPDQGQGWLAAAQAFMDAYEGAHLNTRSGGGYRYTWLSCRVKAAEEVTAAFRESGEIDENTYCFFATVRFVPESDEALQWAMAGNTAPCDDADAPTGAYQYSRCCTVRKDADGWHGQVLGTGW